MSSFSDKNFRQTTVDPEAKKLALQDISWLWKKVPHMIWTTGPGFNVAQITKEQKNLIDLDGAAFLDMNSCGPLFATGPLASNKGQRPPCLDFHHMTGECEFRNCSTDGGHRHRFVNRMKAQSECPTSPLSSSLCLFLTIR